MRNWKKMAWTRNITSKQAVPVSLRRFSEPELHRDKTWKLTPNYDRFRAVAINVFGVLSMSSGSAQLTQVILGLLLKRFIQNEVIPIGYCSYSAVDQLQAFFNSNPLRIKLIYYTVQYSTVCSDNNFLKSAITER
jgi:hypothetical protein